MRRVSATTLIKLKDLTGELSQEDYIDSIDFLLRDTPFVRIAAVSSMIKVNIFKYIQVKWCAQFRIYALKVLQSCKRFVGIESLWYGEKCPIFTPICSYLSISLQGRIDFQERQCKYWHIS